MLGFAETSLRMGGHQMGALSTRVDVSSERTRKVGSEGNAPEGLKLNLEWSTEARAGFRIPIRSSRLVRRQTALTRSWNPDSSASVGPKVKAHTYTLAQRTCIPELGAETNNVRTEHMTMLGNK